LVYHYLGTQCIIINVTSASAVLTIGAVFFLIPLNLFVGQAGVLVGFEVVDDLFDRLGERVLHDAGAGGLQRRRAAAQALLRARRRQ